MNAVPASVEIHARLVRPGRGNGRRARRDLVDFGQPGQKFRVIEAAQVKHHAVVAENPQFGAGKHHGQEVVVGFVAVVAGIGSGAPGGDPGSAAGDDGRQVAPGGAFATVGEEARRVGVGAPAHVVDLGHPGPRELAPDDRREVHVGLGAAPIDDLGPVPGHRGEALGHLGADHVVVGLFDPVWRPDVAVEVAATGATMLALDLVPRSTRAQAVDVLSSQATVEGFQSVLLAASRLPKMLPLLMTAAGTVPPARVLVLGAGVAGLQAIATARRLGAVVEGFDIREEALEQIRSLGAKSIDPPPAPEGGVPDAVLIHEVLTPHVAEADVVIAAAQIPGRQSPLLVTESMVTGMRPGSVLVDLAVQRGGNCEVSIADTEVDHGGVTVLGPRRDGEGDGSAQVRQIVLQREGTETILHRGDSGWTAGEAVADSAALQGILGLLPNLSLTAFTSEEEAAAADFSQAQTAVDVFYSAATEETPALSLLLIQDEEQGHEAVECGM